MSDYIVAPQAGEDVFRIWRYLYRRAGLDVANRIESELYGAFEALATLPGKGHTRTDLTSHPVHFFAVYSYMIVYRSREPLEIVRVLHGRRNLRRILR
jgi:plasmid stabilization system protein ParE